VELDEAEVDSVCWSGELRQQAATTALVRQFENPCRRARATICDGPCRSTSASATTRLGRSVRAAILDGTLMRSSILSLSIQVTEAGRPVSQADHHDDDIPLRTPVGRQGSCVNNDSSDFNAPWQYGL